MERIPRMSHEVNPIMRDAPLTARLDTIRAAIEQECLTCARCGNPFPVPYNQDVHILALRRLIGPVCIHCRTTQEICALGTAYAISIKTKALQFENARLLRSLNNLYKFVITHLPIKAGSIPAYADATGEAYDTLYTAGVRPGEEIFEHNPL